MPDVYFFLLSFAFISKSRELRRGKKGMGMMNPVVLKQWFLTKGYFAPPGGIWKCLEIFLDVITEGVGVLLESSR